jgi:hypothetical protein
LRADLAIDVGEIRMYRDNAWIVKDPCGWRVIVMDRQSTIENTYSELADAARQIHERFDGIVAAPDR